MAGIFFRNLPLWNCGGQCADPFLPTPRWRCTVISRVNSPQLAVPVGAVCMTRCGNGISMLFITPPLQEWSSRATSYAAGLCFQWHPRFVLRFVFTPIVGKHRNLEVLQSKERVGHTESQNLFDLNFIQDILVVEQSDIEIDRQVLADFGSQGIVPRHVNSIRIFKG